MSEAYDALGSAGMELDEYREVLGIARERLKLEDRLVVSERMDARTVLAWCHAILGELPQSLAEARGVTALLGPGQGLTFQLGAFAWQIHVLWSLGRWDEAVAALRQLQEVWAETDRTAAGYALHGWFAGLEIARARRDEELVEVVRGAIENITNRFADGTRAKRQIALLKPDLPAIATEIIGAWRLWSERLDALERPLLVCADRGHALDPAILRDMADYFDAHEVRLGAAHARRALGLATADPEPLKAALRSFEAMGTPPLVARVQADLGRMTQDDELTEAGLATLESLGDVDHLARLAARRAS